MPMAHVAETLQLTIFNRRWANMAAICRLARFDGLGVVVIFWVAAQAPAAHTRARPASVGWT